MSIKTLKSDINHIRKDINLFFKMAEYCQDDNSYITLKNKKTKIKDENKKILKATIFLMLYNLIESTITRLINEISDEINRQEVSYDVLNNYLKKAWIDIHCKNRLLNCKNENFSEIAIQIINDCNNKNKITFIHNNFKGLFSGNINSSSIKNICFKHGLNFVKECTHIDTIKEKRNNLAHGEASFSDIGREYTISDLKIYKDETYHHLDLLTKSVKNYIKNKDFIKK